MSAASVTSFSDRVFQFAAEADAVKHDTDARMKCFGAFVSFLNQEGSLAQIREERYAILRAFIVAKMRDNLADPTIGVVLRADMLRLIETLSACSSPTTSTGGSAASSGVASYAYKPTTGLEGASTVVPLKKGGFLEVRRGEKTTWARGEERHVWATLDEWKATLPSDAVIEERDAHSASRSVRCRIIEGPAPPADFLTAMRVYREATGKDPRSVLITIENNATEAKRWNDKADVYRSYSVTAKLQKDRLAYCQIECQLREKAAAELVKPAYERCFCRRYHWKGANKNVLYAQRISDGEFIPIYFDIRKQLLHTPSEEVFQQVGAKGATFAALDLRPVFMVPVSNLTGRLRMISLEKPAATE